MTTDNKQHTAAPARVLLGHELGTAQVWDAGGCLVSLTAVQIGTNVVIQIRIKEASGYSTIRPGFGEIPARKVTKSMAGRFAKAGVEPHRHLAEIRASAADNYELGQESQAIMFETGQAVNVSGNTKGKGFTGVMKCHGFADISASHGARRNHRKPGPTGACVTPGRIFKGLHMVSRVGDVRRTVQNLKTRVVDAEGDLLFINDAIPGSKNGVVLVRSSVKGA